jgi:cation diffusion facilitator CzcD-associated flavoprotein CzcO
LNPNWSRLYSPGGEIQAYFEQVARDYDVESHVRFGDEVVRCEFVDAVWHLTTAAGHQGEADVVIAATGVLHHPKYPDIPGLESFDGKAFHSARWDHTATIDGARVGIVGTGSTAVQIVTAIVKRTAKLVLFQRTAQWVMPIPNNAYTQEERDEFCNNPGRVADLHKQLDQLFDRFSDALVTADSPQMKMIEDACRANLEDNVTDLELRERLRPDYRAACKRLIISPSFYDAIQHPNAELVTDAIAGVEPSGVRTADGQLHELDVLVLATGFKADAFVRPMAVVGRDGKELATAWEKRPEAYLSISVPGFPNFFMLNGPNGPVGNFSLIGVAELQLGYIMQLVDRIQAGSYREVSASRTAMEQFEAERSAAAKTTVWASGCHSWYLDDRGVPASWPWPFGRFREAMSAPDWDAYELR